MPVPPTPTTLVYAIEFDQNYLILANGDGIMNPGINKLTPTFLLLGNINTPGVVEYCLVDDSYVDGSHSTTIPVVRGFNTTYAQAWPAGTTVTIQYDLNAPPFLSPPPFPSNDELGQ